MTTNVLANHVHVLANEENHEMTQKVPVQSFEVQVGPLSHHPDLARAVRQGMLSIEAALRLSRVRDVDAALWALAERHGMASELRAKLAVA